MRIVWIARLVALALLGFIAYSTLSPIEMRPRVVTPTLEYLGGFFLLGGAVTASFPDRWKVALVLLLAMPIALEALQLIDPGRHARISDLIFKLIGAAIGFGAARLVIRVVGTRLSGGAPSR